MLKTYAEFQEAMKEKLNMKRWELLLGNLIHLRVAGSKPRARHTLTATNARSWESQILSMLRELPESSLCIVFGTHVTGKNRFYARNEKWYNDHQLIILAACGRGGIEHHYDTKALIYWLRNANGAN
jgi:hypothetical protein